MELQTEIEGPSTVDPGRQRLEMTENDIKRLLAIVRLGDADRLGWWSSHSLDQPAEFVLSEAFPSTWMATGIEMAMESARIRHQAELQRDTAVHLFSDHLPFHRLLEAWLIELKLERDMSPLEWLRETTAENLKATLGPQANGERRGSHLYLGSISKNDIEDAETITEAFDQLVSAYAGLETEFVAPYMDLVDR